MKIYIENSAWNNIGNFFFQNTIYEIFKDIFINHKISSYDGPIEDSFKIKKNNYFKNNAFDLRYYIDGDVFVLSGPILGDDFCYYYENFIKEISLKKRKYIILSAFGKENYKNKKLFEKFPPYAISTRSLDTFNIYKDFSQNSYNGICNAFFMPFYTETPDIDYKRYIIKSFYSMHEPDVSFKLNDNEIDFDTINVKYKKSPFWKIYRHLNFLLKVKDDINDYETIRLIHDLTYKYNHLNFSKKNSYISYNIPNYLSIYKNSSLIVSDRVHSVVMGLAFNKPSILCGKWDRSTLFDRLELKKKGLCFLPPKKEYILNELEKYKKWLKQLF